MKLTITLEDFNNKVLNHKNAIESKEELELFLLRAKALLGSDGLHSSILEDDSINNGTKNVLGDIVNLLTFIKAEERPKTIKQRVFEQMESIGWSLDDFEETLEYHKDTMNSNLDLDIQFDKEDDTTYMYQFMIDFLDSLDKINE